MKESDLTLIEKVTNVTGKGFVIIFEPMAIELSLKPNEEIEVLAVSSNVADSRYEVEKKEGCVIFYSDYLSTFWYLKIGGNIKCLTEEAYGMSPENHDEWWENRNKPWWKFW